MRMADDIFMSSSVLRAVSVRLGRSASKYNWEEFELDIDLDLLPVAAGSSNANLGSSFRLRKCIYRHFCGVVNCEGTRIDEPEGIKKEEYLDLVISDLKGDLLGAFNDTGFMVSTLKIKVDAPQQKSLVLLDSFKINVESMALEMVYHRGQAAASEGFKEIVRLLTGLDVPVKFERTGIGELHEGNFFIESQPDSKPSANSLDLEKVAVKFLPDIESVLIRDGSGVPKTLAVVSGWASFVRGQSASISADITATKWNVKFAKLDIEFSGLEGLVAAGESAQGRWTTAILGKTTFGPFVSAQGALQLCKSKKPILQRVFRRRKRKGPGASKYGFLVALGITGPSALWKKLELQVSEHFNFQSVVNCILFICSLEGASDFKRTAEDATTASRELKELPDEDGKSDPKATAAELTVMSKLLRIPLRNIKVIPGAEFCAFSRQKMNDAETSLRVNITEFTFEGGAITLEEFLGNFVPNEGKAKGLKGVHTLSFKSELDFRIPDTGSLPGLKVNTDLTGLTR
ncbi:MAG: hypothetical protein Q9217_002164 [Psora testacea]